ncbi:ribonuclease HII [Capnocytophaga catalasegens]|uniref:Ribonuclease HII n=1 Tax=Capnocytophaga catalasegens TaxID=1004260 RepID=A0AAV5B0F0_9FLAO|nr:ribonuclease HII [Capnocytophaga catalasegens]GIZ14022.1 ribonuclease HII [Capnocytophaga catalasegens]GJM51093.1 ribonuclease HII [Capnocytophaga catalasegens]GJM54097.1 ribonuclease HII [Capnocytophaga catalasegens]
MQRWYYSFNEAGADEAGRGCLAGPVTAAAVILPEDFENNILNDSKQMTEKQRNILREIIEKEAISYAVVHISPKQIDEINILNASILGMQKALNKLIVKPDFMIIDGNRFKAFNQIPFECMIKGDARFMRIAAASVLAKTYRDEYMSEIHQQFPQYNWKKNKGYPTKEHRDAIRKYGFSPYHRMTFQLLPSQLKFDF